MGAAFVYFLKILDIGLLQIFSQEVPLFASCLLMLHNLFNVFGNKSRCFFFKCKQTPAPITMTRISEKAGKKSQVLTSPG